MSLNITCRVIYRNSFLHGNHNYTKLPYKNKYEHLNEIKSLFKEDNWGFYQFFANTAAFHNILVLRYELIKQSDDFEHG